MLIIVVIEQCINSFPQHSFKIIVSIYIILKSFTAFTNLFRVLVFNCSILVILKDFFSNQMLSILLCEKFVVSRPMHTIDKHHVHLLFSSAWVLYEPPCEKTGFRGFRPGPT